MTDLPDSKLDELAAKAKAAMPGPWEVGLVGNCNVVHFDGDNVRPVAQCSAPVAAYIAAANPTTILALVEELRRRRADARVAK